jgi:hypothetical protein
MNFGLVKIQTAAKDSHFLFEDVPNPQKIKDLVMEFVDKEDDKKEHGGQ